MSMHAGSPCTQPLAPVCSFSACRLQGATNKNVLGGALKSCCQSPKTGFYRDGYCRVGPEDGGEHNDGLLGCSLLLQA